MTAKANAPAPEDAGAITFEQMMGRLQDLVAKLEEGQLSLDESIRSPSDSSTVAVAVSGSQISVTVVNSPRLDGVPSGWVMSRRAKPARSVTG